MGLNSPLPARLQEETKKAAKIIRSFVDSHNNGLDKVIPQSVLQKAAGFAIFTVFKAGFLFSARAGSGVVIARTSDGSWSPPSAIGLGGFGFGGQLGAEVTDFLIVLNSTAAVKSFMSAGSLTLGGNLSIAVGPLGRNAEGSGALNTKGKMAAMYSYSKTKGLFGGVSVEGSIILERQDANRLAYGGSPTVKQLLSGSFDPPEWAFPLIDEIERCTGMPGGQRWQSWDEDGEGGGMGWASPGGERGGYVFGEGDNVGSSPGKESKSKEKEGRRRGASVGVFDQPVRPSPSKRTSSFNPFSSGSSSPKRNAGGTGAGQAGMSSSENYNAGLTWDSSGPMTSYGTRSRSGSSALKPAFDLEGRARSYSDPKARRGVSRRDIDRGEAGYDEDEGLRAGGGQDLVDIWKPEEKGLSSSFARLRTDDMNGSANSRSQSNSKPPLPSFEEDEYVTYETESRMATRRKNGHGHVNGNGAGGTGVNRLLAEESDPFGGDSLTTGRAFESYRTPSPASFDDPSTATSRPSHSRQRSSTNITLKSGLGTNGPGETGYARAIALFDLPAGQPGDLGLKKGAVIYAMDKVGENGTWWRGMNLHGEVGIFPANYVEVVEIPQELKGGLRRGELKARVPGLDFD